MFATGPVGLAIGAVGLIAGAASAYDSCRSGDGLGCGIGIAGTVLGGAGMVFKGASLGVRALQGGKLSCFLRGGKYKSLRYAIRKTCKPAIARADGALDVAGRISWGADVGLAGNRFIRGRY